MPALPPAQERRRIRWLEARGEPVRSGGVGRRSRDVPAPARSPFHAARPRHLKIGAINFFPTTGKITVDGGTAGRPGTGLRGLERLLRQRGFVRRRAGAETGGTQRWDEEKRDCEQRLGRMGRTVHEAERKRDDALATLKAAEDRLSAEAAARKDAERRLSAVTAERDALRDQLRRQGPGASDTRSAHRGDDKMGLIKMGLIKQIKRAFAQRRHPGGLAPDGPTRAVREQVFKEFSSELERIERS